MTNYKTLLRERSKEAYQRAQRTVNNKEIAKWYEDILGDQEQKTVSYLRGVYMDSTGADAIEVKVQLEDQYNQQRFMNCFGTLLIAIYTDGAHAIYQFAPRYSNCIDMSVEEYIKIIQDHDLGGKVNLRAISL